MPARFTRLLRQANDAEIADVRKVGEDDYEISPHRTSGVPAIAAPAPSAAAMAAANTEELPVAARAADAGVEPAGRSENGQRLGVRFRRGSRGPLRAGEIPLIGVVQMDAPAEPVGAVAVLEEPAVGERAGPAEAGAPARAAEEGRGGGRDGSGAGSKGGDDAEPAAPRAKRPRARAKKKAE